MTTYRSNRLRRWNTVVMVVLGLCVMVGAGAVSESSLGAPGSAGASLVVTWSPTCETPPPDAEMALDDAAGLWSGWISSTVPIEVSACWTPNLSGGDTLGTGMPTGYIKNFVGAPLADVQYPIALANALSGVDLRPSSGDIVLSFKSSAAWTFDTTMHAPGVGEDFVTVALHELGHGLGFISNMYVDYSVGFCGDGIYGSLYPCPTPYDWFMVDSTGTPLLDTKTPDPRDLGDRLKSDANFGGPNTLAANGASAATLYTPALFSFGTSLSHLDPATFGDGINALMTPSYSGVARHPGPVTLAMMQDMGWLRADAPNVIAVGETTAVVGQASSWDATLVWPAYAGQPLTYTWMATGHADVVHAGLGVTDTVTLAWTQPGRKVIVITATGEGVSTSATAMVAVRYQVHLPLVIRGL